MVRGLSLPWWAHTREVETAVPSNSRCDQVPVNTISCYAMLHSAMPLHLSSLATPPKPAVRVTRCSIDSHR